MGLIRSARTESEPTRERMREKVAEVRSSLRQGCVDADTVWGWLTHPWAWVREATLEELGDLPPRPDLYDTLAAMVDEPVARDVRVVLPSVLENFGPRAESTLLVLLRDEWWEVRNNAVLALGRVGTARSVPELLRVCEFDPEILVRRNAKEVVSRIEGR